MVAVAKAIAMTLHESPPDQNFLIQVSIVKTEVASKSPQSTFVGLLGNHVPLIVCICIRLVLVLKLPQVVRQ